MIPPSDRYCAAVCRNGHIIKDTLNPPSQRGKSRVTVGVLAPEAPPFCGRCGAPVLKTCRSCNALLLGAYALYMGSESLQQPESFCWGCGEPYPWATRQERINQLYALVDDEDLEDEADLLAVREQIAVLSKPDDEVTEEQRVRAGKTIKELAPKAWEIFRPVAQSVLTAEVRRRLGLP